MKNVPNSLKITLMLVVGMMFLAACSGGDETPTETVPPTQESDSSTLAAATPEEENSGPNIFPTLETTATRTPAPVMGVEPDATNPVELPIIANYGTLTFASTSAPLDMPDDFTRITIVRTGGPSEAPEGAFDETIVIEGDGRMTRNGAEGRASVDAIRQINRMLDAVDLFTVQANFAGIDTGDGTFRYRLTLVQGTNERMLVLQDSLMPQEIANIVSAVIAEGFKIPRP